MTTRAFGAAAAAVLALSQFVAPTLGAQVVGTEVPLTDLNGDDALGDHNLEVTSGGKAYAVFTVKRSGGGRSILLATRPKGGSWSVTEVAAGNVDEPDVAADDAGNVVIVWVKSIGGLEGHGEVWCKRVTADPTDFSIDSISNQTHNARTPSVVIDASQRATVMWFDDDPDPTVGTYDNDPRVMGKTGTVVDPNATGVSICSPGGSELPMLSGSSSPKPYSPVSLAVDGQDNVVATWTEWTGSNPVVSAVAVSRQAAGTGVWSTEGIATDATQPNGVVALDIAAGNAGTGTPGDVTVGWLSYTSTVQSAMLSTRPGSGLEAGVWATKTVNAAGMADNISVAGAPDGGTAAAVSLRASGTTNRLDFLERPGGAVAWSSAVTLSAGAHAGSSDLAIDPAGAVTAAWQTGTGEEDITTRHRPPGTATWDALVPVTDAGSSSDVRVAVDATGVGTLLWTNFGATGSEHAASLSEPPPAASMTKPSTPYQKSKTFTVAWTATGGTGTKTYDVRYRKATPAGSFGSYTTWKSATTLTSASFTGSAGTTCFSVQATASGVTGAWSAEKCGVIPVDDRSLTASSGWTSKTATGYYLGTYRQATTSGKYLKYTVKGKAFAVAVGKGPGYGSMKVYLGSTLLGTFSLSSSTTQKGVIVNVKTYTSVKSGTLKIVVSTSSKKVLIDSVYVRQ